jgi:hypothetical protein
MLIFRTLKLEAPCGQMLISDPFEIWTPTRRDETQGVRLSVLNFRLRVSEGPAV